MLTIHQNLNPWHHHPFTPTSLKTSFYLPIRITNTIQKNNQTEQTSSAGKIKRQVLTKEGRTKLNISSDRDFYAFPRFVTHVDDNFISTLTNLYKERLSPGSEILDLMSSWVSHLPKEVQYKRVVGHGLNAQELAKNPRLDYFFVKDLNQDQKLELESCSLDAVLCTVSVQYLQQPEKVFAEVFRVLRPGGVFIVSFSNRMFYEKAIGAWREGGSTRASGCDWYTPEAWFIFLTKNPNSQKEQLAAPTLWAFISLIFNPKFMCDIRLESPCGIEEVYGKKRGF